MTRCCGTLNSGQHQFLKPERKAHVLMIAPGNKAGQQTASQSVWHILPHRGAAPCLHEIIRSAVILHGMDPCNKHANWLGVAQCGGPTHSAMPTPRTFSSTACSSIGITSNMVTVTSCADQAPEGRWQGG